MVYVIPFWAGEALFTILWIALRCAVCLRRGRVDRKREALLLLMYVNLAVLIRFTFFPMDRLDGKVQPLLFYPSLMFPLRINLKPLVHILRYETRRDVFLNVIGNVSMFIPTGIILPILYPKLRSFWKTVAVGALLSLCIEIIQLPFSVRATDIDDLILNTLGVVIGYAIYAVVKALKKGGS